MDAEASGTRRDAPAPSALSYFRQERGPLILTAITGTIYNVGMAAGPLFEGQLVQYLYDILSGTRVPRDLALLSLAYAAVIALVQVARALKRLYVREFANDVSLSMRRSIFRHLLCEPYDALSREDAGSLMTRAIADADDCAEGMRKFTTEVFDTGVVMVAYLVTLLALDWRLTLIAIAFPPIAYVVSARLKERVVAASAESKQAMSALNDAAVDAVGNALTYRSYGEEAMREAAYERDLAAYERANVRSGIWQNSPQPAYFVISMISVIPILWFGSRNVLGAGWAAWSIATFSSFLSCFTKLATKSSHAAKLFNAVQKARVSWERIKGYLGAEELPAEPAAPAAATLELRDAGISYPDGGFALSGLDLAVRPGEIVGVCGKVASGKSSFGRMFLGELPHEGRILYGGREVAGPYSPIFSYMGHDPELFSGSVRDNVCFGREDEARLAEVLREARIDGEVGPDDEVGQEGCELSGGQQARVALARALFSPAPVLILDDPFSAVDAATEREIFEELRAHESWRSILLISHRMAMFPQMDQVVLLDGGRMASGTHDELMKDAHYASLYALQCGGGGRHE